MGHSGRPVPILLAGLTFSTCVGHALARPPQAEAEPVDEGIEEVYLTLEQALKVVLPHSKEVTLYAGTNLPVYIGKTGGQVDGYAVVTEEIGMYKPITSMVGVTPDGRVGEVAVMVYRESRGGDVRRKRFLSQYRGKKMSDPIRINKDIINVTGATLSVRSMNAQVREALATVQELFLKEKP